MRRCDALADLKYATLAALPFLVSLVACQVTPVTPTPLPTPAMQAIPLPAPRTYGDLSLEAAIAGRRSVRASTDQALTRAQLSQLLWAAQNLLLQTVALGLGGAPIGAFYDDPLQTALALPKDHAPLYLLAVGYPDE